MKKLLLFVLTSLFVGGALFAQTEESGKVKNEGNAAWRAKNYKEAFAKWEQYLKLIEFKDDATVYNVAVCANKLKDYANAEKYFGMSIKNNYKVASSYLGMADAQENLKKIPEMLKTLQDGIKATPHILIISLKKVRNSKKLTILPRLRKISQRVVRFLTNN